MSTNDQTYPQNGFAFFNSRDEFGEIEQGQSQCFRVFETAESFANVDSIIKARLTEAQSVFGSIGTLVSNGNVAKLRELKYALAFIGEWIRDGLYKTADSGEPKVFGIGQTVFKTKITFTNKNDLNLFFCEIFDLVA